MRYALDKSGKPVCKACDITVMWLFALSLITLIASGIWAVWSPSELVAKVAGTAAIIALVSGWLYSTGSEYDA